VTKLPPRIIAVGLLLALGLTPQLLRAQFRDPTGPDRQGGPAGWAPVAVGARVGFDNAQSEPMVGALVRIPVLPSGAVELLPNVDVTFRPGFKEYQFNFEAVYVLGGRRGGLYFGGGAGFRNSVFSPDPTVPRRNEGTYSIVAGVRIGNLGRIRPEIESRWIFQDALIRDPRLVAFGVSLALW